MNKSEIIIELPRHHFQTEWYLQSDRADLPSNTSHYFRKWPSIEKDLIQSFLRMQKKATLRIDEISFEYHFRQNVMIQIMLPKGKHNMK